MNLPERGMETASKKKKIFFMENDEVNCNLTFE